MRRNTGITDCFGECHCITTVALYTGGTLVLIFMQSLFMTSSLRVYISDVLGAGLLIVIAKLFSWQAFGLTLAQKRTPTLAYPFTS